jgi:hypothetical protein
VDGPLEADEVGPRPLAGVVPGCLPVAMSLGRFTHVRRAPEPVGQRPERCSWRSTPRDLVHLRFGRAPEDLGLGLGHAREVQRVPFAEPLSVRDRRFQPLGGVPARHQGRVAALVAGVEQPLPLRAPDDDRLRRRDQCRPLAGAVGVGQLCPDSEHVPVGQSVLAEHPPVHGRQVVEPDPVCLAARPDPVVRQVLQQDSAFPRGRACLRGGAGGWIHGSRFRFRAPPRAGERGSRRPRGRLGRAAGRSRGRPPRPAEGSPAALSRRPRPPVRGDSCSRRPSPRGPRRPAVANAGP